ncbi:hypothetical protein JQC72_13315 [Polycladomyces sp. WAk]|uniref:LAGLIDADG endonuclease n=1 Tax=Polycladomyces zharkentensis TaxID=2807616 RepID=A0ABS2WLM5_9BACL|nr:hypothetical protein [Polycladomyces sp. WAk]MBN2910480.1 hypothetical protein [Polycladomyces sp. WAk]
MSRRQCLKSCLKEAFGDQVSITGDSTGLHLIAEFKNVAFHENTLLRIHQHKVKIYPVELHSIQKGLHRNKVILGYGNLDEKKIDEEVRRLKQALRYLPNKVF